MARSPLLSTKKIFIPGQQFPGISVTGSSCALHCSHCDGHYLKHMLDGSTPEKLMSHARRLAKQNATGFLLSGGCTPDGRVPIGRFFDTLTTIKKETSLLINVHPGLINVADIEPLAETGIDAVSVDIVGDEAVAQHIYALPDRTINYETILDHLMKSTITRIVPHICIGLSGTGEITHEYRALNMVARYPLKTMVFIIFIPTKNTQMEHALSPSDDDILTFLHNARRMLPPPVEIMLGCMRPRGHDYLEKKALAVTGIDGIVLPSQKVIKELSHMNMRFRTFNRCCALS